MVSFKRLAQLNLRPTSVRLPMSVRLVLATLVAATLMLSAATLRAQEPAAHGEATAAHGEAAHVDVVRVAYDVPSPR